MDANAEKYREGRGGRGVQMLKNGCKCRKVSESRQSSTEEVAQELFHNIEQVNKGTRGQNNLKTLFLINLKLVSPHKNVK